MSFTEGFVPSPADTFEILSFHTVAGDFDSESGFQISDNVALARIVGGTSMALVAEDTSVDAESARVALNNGLAQLRDQIPTWVSGFDLDESLIAVLPDELATIFGLGVHAADVAGETLVELTDPVTTIPELATQLDTALGDRVTLLCGGEGNVCIDGKLIEAEVVMTVANLLATDGFDSETGELMQQLAANLGLSGDMAMAADLSITVRFGIDDAGFYVDGDSGAMLAVHADAEVSGEVGLANLLSIEASGSAGTGASSIVAEVSPTAVGRLRLEQFDSVDDITASVSGSASVDLDLTIQPIGLTFAGGWQFAFGDGVDVQHDVDFPTEDELLLAALRTLSGGVNSMFGQQLIDLFNSTNIPLLSGSPQSPDAAITTAAANDDALWLARVLNGLKLFFTEGYQFDNFGNYLPPTTGSVASDGLPFLNLAGPQLDGLRGNGVKLGVLSDGAESFAQAQSAIRPEITPDKVILHETLGLGRGDEGTATMEIIHDIAPEAELYFAPVDSVESYLIALDWFAANDVKVVVDDIELDGQPWFDLASDPISQRIQELAASEEMFFIGAAGNEFGKFYESPLELELGTIGPLDEGEFEPGETETGFFHVFDPSKEASDEAYLLPIFNIGGHHLMSPEVTIQWSDDFNDPAFGFEALLYGGNVVADGFSRTLLDTKRAGNQIPIGSIDVNETASIHFPAKPLSEAFPLYFVAIRYKESLLDSNFDPADLPEIRLAVRSNGAVELRPIEGSLRGDNKLSEVFTVGALRISQNVIGVASDSDRGQSYVFDSVTGELQLGSGIDVVAPSGTFTAATSNFGSSTSSGIRFDGSSASAAHVAGVAALIRSGLDQSAITAAQMREAMIQATDITLRPLLAPDYYKLPIGERVLGGMVLDVLANDYDLAGISDGSVAFDPLTQSSSQGDLEIKSATALHGTVEVFENKIIYTPLKSDLPKYEPTTGTVPYDVVTYTVGEGPLHEMSQTAEVWLESFGTFANPDLLQVDAFGGNINVLFNDYLGLFDTIDNVRIQTDTETALGGTIAVGSQLGELDYTPADGFSGFDTVSYRIVDTDGNALAEANLNILVNADYDQLFNHDQKLLVAGSELIRKSAFQGRDGFLFDPLFDSFASAPLVLVGARVVGDAKGLRVAVTDDERPQLQLIAERASDTISGIYEIELTIADTVDRFAPYIESKLELYVDWFSGPIPREQIVLTEGGPTLVRLKPALDLPSETVFGSQIPGEPSGLPGQPYEGDRQLRLVEQDLGVFYERGRLLEREDYNSSFSLYEYGSPSEALNQAELQIVSLDPFSITNGFDGYTGYGLVNAELARGHLLSSVTPPSEAELSSDLLASSFAEGEAITRLKLIDVINSLPGFTVENWIGEENIIPLLTGQLDDVSDILTIRYQADAEEATPARATFDFADAGIGALETLGLTGSVDGELRPLISVGFGLDTEGVYVTRDSSVGGSVLGRATVNGSLGPLDATGVGQVTADAVISLSGLDSNDDGRIRLQELPNADFSTVLEVDVSNVGATLSLDLSSELLDYVDADGNPENNTENGGDVFHLVASTSIEVDANTLAATWNDIEIADSAFTSEVLAENFRQLALAVVKGERTVVNEALFDAIADRVPAIGLLAGNEGLADVLQLESAFAASLLDATSVSYVIPLTDPGEGDNENNSIEDWLNRGIPENSEVIRVAVDLARANLAPKEGVSFDVDSLFPGVALEDLNIGIRNIEVDGQFVLGLDTSNDPFYLLTEDDELSEGNSNISVQFDTFVDFTGKPLFGTDVISFETASAEVTSRISLDYDGSDGKIGLVDAASALADLNVTIVGGDLMTFRADGAQVQTLLGPLSVTDDDDTDNVRAVVATIDLTNQTITGTMDRVQGGIEGLVSVDADDVQFAFGDDFGSDEAILSSTLATASYDFFIGSPIAMSATDFRINRDGRVTATRLQTGSEDGLLATSGLGGLLPFDVTKVGIEIPSDVDGANVAFDLFDFTYEAVTGDLDLAQIDVTGTFDLSLYEGTPLNPSIQIGGNPLPTGPNDRFTFTYQYRDGKLVPFDVGPIAIAIESQVAPGIELNGEITLGGYEDGVWNSDLRGNLTATLDADEDQGELAVTILPGSTLNIQTGVLDLRAEVTLEADIAGSIGGFEFDGGVLPFQMIVDVDQNSDGAFVLGDFQVQFGELQIERLYFELSELLVVEASGITVDPNAGASDPIASIARIDVVAPSTSIFAGLEVSVAGSDVLLYDDRLLIRELDLLVSGTLSLGMTDLLYVDGLQVTLSDLEIAYGGFSGLVDRQTVSTDLNAAFSLALSRIDISLLEGIVFPDTVPTGVVPASGVASLSGLLGSIEPTVSGTPVILAMATTVDLSTVGGVSFSANDVEVALFGDDELPLFRVAQAGLEFGLLGQKPIKLTANDLLVTSDGTWSIESADLDAGDGLATSLGLAGIVPIDVVGTSVQAAPGERVVLLSSDETVNPDSLDVFVEFKLSDAFFDNLPFEPLLIIDGVTIGNGNTFDLGFEISNFDSEFPEVAIKDTGELTLGINNYNLGPFSVHDASVTLGGYVDGAFQTNFGADVLLSFVSSDFDLFGGVFIDPDTSRLILPDTTDDPSLPDVAMLKADISVTGSVGVGSLSILQSQPGSGFAIDNLSTSLQVNLGVEFTEAGPRLFAVEDQPFIRLGDGVVSVDRVAVQLGDAIGMEATDVNLNFDAFEVDDAGNFLGVNGPFITLGGTAPARVDPSEDEFLSTLSGGDGSLAVTLGDPNDPNSPLAGFGGSAGNFGIGFSEDSPIGVTLIPLDGMFVSLTAPDDFNFGLPDFIPLRLTELGIQLPDDLGALMPVGGLENLGDVGELAFDVFSNSTLNVSGGVDSVEGGWPIRLLVEDLEIDLDSIRQWGELVLDPARVEGLKSDVRDRVRSLAEDGKTLEAIGAIGIDVLQSVDIPPIIKNLDAVDFGIDGFDLGPLTLGGGLGFGVLDIDTPAGEVATLFGRVFGEFTYDGIGIGVELIVTEHGPVLGRILAGAPIPLGTLVGAIAGSAVPAAGTAAGAAVGSASGFVITGLQGGLLFDGTPLPTINDPQEILSVPEIQDPLNVNMEEIRDSVRQAILAGGYTWDNGFKLIGSGMLTNIYAQGLASIKGTFGVNVAKLNSDEQQADDPFGVQFYGLGSVNVLGQELASTGVLFDFADPINPVLNMAAAIPGANGNLLSFLLPVEAGLGLRLDTQGIATGAVVAVGEMVDQIVNAGASELTDLFTDLAAELNEQRGSVLSTILLRDQDPDTEITFELLRDRLVEIVGNQVDDLINGTKTSVDQSIQDAILTAAEVFRGLTELYSASVEELSRLKREYREGISSVKTVIDSVVGNIGDGATAQARVLRDLIRNVDLTRVPRGDNGYDQGLDASESAATIDAEFFFEQFDRWKREAKSAQRSHPWIDVSLVEFIADEFMQQVRNVDATLAPQRLFDAIADNPVIGAVHEGIRSQFVNLAELTNPFAQPLVFASSKAFASAKAVLERQFQTASAIGTIVGSSGSAGLETFFDIIDPSLTIEGSIQPSLLGIPIGEPTDELSVTIDKRELSFGGTFRIVEKLQLLAQMPLPLQDRINLEVSIPFDNLFRDLATGGIPAVDPSRDWRAGFQGTVSLYGLFDLGDVSGIAFPAIVTGEEIPADHPLLTRVQTTDNLPPVSDVDPIVVTTEDFQTLRENGGVLLDGRLTLPQFITDPFAWFEDLQGIAADLLIDKEGQVIDACRVDSGGDAGERLGTAFECFLNDPGSFLDAGADLLTLLGSESQVAQVQAYVPDVSDELAGFVDVNDPERVKAAVLALSSGDAEAVFDLIDPSQVNAVARELLEKSYFRGQIGSAAGGLSTTGKLLGIDFGGATVQYADPDPNDGDPDQRSLLIAGNIAGAVGRFEFGNTDGGVPAFGGRLSVGAHAEGDIQPPIDQLESLLRSNPITGSNELLQDLADFIFEDSGDENETEPFGATLKAYSPGFSRDASAPAIERLGGVEVIADLNLNNEIGSLVGSLDFSVAPDLNSPLGIKASGSFRGYGALSLGGLVNLPIGNADDPLVEGILTEDGLLVLDVSAGSDGEGGSQVDFVGAELQLLINLNDEASEWDSNGTLVSIGAGQVRLAVHGGLQFGELSVNGSFLIDVEGGRVTVAGSGSLDVGLFGDVLDNVGGAVTVVGAWQGSPASSSGAFGSVLVSAGVSAGNDFFGGEVAISVAVNTTTTTQTIPLSDIATAGVSVPLELRSLLSLGPQALRVFASGNLDLAGIELGGAFTFERSGNQLDVNVAANASLLGASARLAGQVVMDSGSFISGRVEGSLSQLGTSFLAIKNSSLIASLSGGNLTAQLRGGQLDLPLGPDLDLPTININVAADDLVPRGLTLDHNDLNLDDFFRVPAGVTDAFEISFTDGLLKLERRPNQPITPLVAIAGSNLTLRSLLFSADLNNPADTRFEATVSGQLGAGDLRLVSGMYDVSLNNGAIEFATVTPTEIRLPFLDVDVAGFVRTDGTFVLDGDASLDATFFGTGVQGQLDVEIDQNGVDIEFTGSIVTPIGVNVSGTGGITRAGCLSLEGFNVPLAAGACGPSFSINDRSLNELNPTNRRETRTFTFTITMDRPLGFGEPSLVGVPVFLEVDDSVPASRRAKIGNVPATTSNGILYSNDDVKPGIAPMVYFTNDGDLTKTVTVKVFRDRAVESNETFRLRLGNPVDAGNHPFGAVDDGIGIGTIINDDNPPATSPQVGTRTGTAANGYLEDATVFFDANRNGLLDEGEPTASTQADGSFSLSVLRSLDTNSNGTYDDEEGVLVAVGGVDSGTGLIQRSLLRAPADSLNITPLTTIITSLVDDFDLSVPDATEAVLQYFAIDPSVSLTLQDHLQEAANGDQNAAIAEASVVMANNAAVVLSAVLQSAGDLRAEDASAAAFHAIAEAVLSREDTGSLTNVDSLQGIFDSALKRQSMFVDPVIVTTIARVVSEGNAAVAAVPVTGSEAYLVAIKRVQAVAMGETADDLHAYLSGDLPQVEFVSRNTSTGLAERIHSASVGNVLPIEVSLSDSEFTTITRSASVNQRYFIRLSEASRSDVVVTYEVFDFELDESIGDSQSETIPAGQTDVPIDIVIDSRSINFNDPRYAVFITDVAGAVADDNVGTPRFDLPPQTIELIPDGENEEKSLVMIRGSERADYIKVLFHEASNQVVVLTDGVVRGTYNTDEISRIELVTGAGNDVVRTVGQLPLNMVVDAGDGNDFIQTGAGDDLVLAGAGIDKIATHAGNDIVFAGEGNDLVFAHSGDDQLHGDGGSDFLYGSDGDDTIDGGDGRDWISGQDGDDLLHGGDGNDHIVGGIGNDTLHGGAGRDRMFGRDGDDEMHGGDGNDVMLAGRGNDTVNGDEGNDSIDLGLGDDVADGGAGRDDIDGRSGDDTIRGGDGNDHLRGSRGNDELIGGPGNDLIKGQSGDDLLVGDPIQDRLLGGPGNDRVIEETVVVASLAIDLEQPTAVTARDTNQDGRVSALDALLIINAIARGGDGRLAVEAESEDFMDVNRDHQVSALDALLIINQLAFVDTEPSDETSLATRLEALLVEEVLAEESRTRELFETQEASIHQQLDDPNEEDWRDSVDAAMSQFDLLLT
ncbi:MAG: dockerin type I domain-containing protein [Rubripirellula sp.]